MSAHSSQLWSSSLKGHKESSQFGWLFAGSSTLIILLVGAIIVWAFMRSTEQAAVELTQRTLDGRANRIEKLVSERLGICEAVLHAGVGFAHNAWPFSAEQWRRFVRPLLRSSVTPGVQGFGFVGVVKKMQPALVDPRSANVSLDSSPLNAERVMTAILYLEPQDARNRRAIGFDMASEPVRWAAMQRARDEGTVALSGVVTLVQEIDAKRQPGFLMYVPVYERDSPTSTVNERREALLGYVFSPFRAFDFFDEVFAEEPDDVLIEVYDGNVSMSDGRMYTRGMQPASEAMSALRRVSVAGHDWTLRVTSTPRLIYANQRVPRGLILGIGVTGTLLLSGLAFATARSRQMLRERHIADVRLLEKERYAATMLESALEAFIVINERDEVEEWNTQASEIFGWTRDEVLGKCLADLIVPERKREAHVNAIRNFHSREHSVLGKRVDMPAIRRDGTEILIALSIASVLRRGQTVFFASLRDITARRQQETRILQLNATLEQLVDERTRALETARRQLEFTYRDLETFTRNVSHDLRAPLRTHQEYSGWLARYSGKPSTSEAQREFSDTANRMGQIIDGLLKLVSVSQCEIKMEALVLGELVRQIVTESQPPDHVRIHIEGDQLGRICVDPELLGLALRGLISNAIKFSQKSSHPEVGIAVMECDDECVCCVRDNGVGFDPRYATRMFGAFQRLHSEPEIDGTGLGLSIVKSAIERNHGRVWAESTPGEGASFYFACPLAKEWVAR